MPSPDRLWPANAVRRAVRVGGLTKPELLSELQRGGISLNEAAHALFGHEAFVTSDAPSIFETIEVSVGDLGLTSGGSFDEVLRKATDLGLLPGPLELAPHLRLQFLDQPEGARGFPASKHRAPPGSITVVSRELSRDPAVPRGFYLRRIEGALWLRGYTSTAEHVWSPEDRLLFCCRDEDRVSR